MTFSFLKGSFSDVKESFTKVPMAGINAGAGTGPNANFFDFAEGPVPSRRFLVAADGEVAAVGEEAPEPFEGTEAEIAEPQTAQADLQDEDSEGCERGEDQSERGAEAEAETVESTMPMSV